jgi:protein-L-isoaspartate(D-aspartate) O-methyltransferase
MKTSLKHIALTLGLLLSACAQESALETLIQPSPSPFQTISSTKDSTPTEPVATPSPTPIQEHPRQDERDAMVQSGIIGWGIQNQAAIKAMLSVPRHEFVPDDYQSLAYNNHPLPIGYGQTISQPYIVALMTEAIEPHSDYRVLEIGTGSGYQGAVLAQLVDQVYSIEIIKPLASRAEEVLGRLGYDNVSIRYADGYFGWEEHAPFDAIVVTAAPDHIPQPLVQQLKIGGKMVIPVGPVGGYQSLWLITRVDEEKVVTEDLGGVRFVPLTREER